MKTNKNNRKWLFISIGSFGFGVLVLIVGLLFGSHIGTAPSQADTNEQIKPEMQILQSLNEAYIELAKKAIPPVVKIKSETGPKKSDIQSRRRGSDQFSDPFDFGDIFRFFDEVPNPRPMRGWGSGFIVDKEGHIITNNHVVAGADKILVTLDDKREFKAKVVGTDPDTDIAVIKVDRDDLPVAKLGDSDKIQVGEMVIAIGSPFELTRTVTNGIVSATGRSGTGVGITYEDFIQTNAAINPGNSGGPLVNIKGEVIGINTAIATGGLSGGNVGVGFAIPINTAKNIMEQLLSDKKIVRGWLGVALQPVDSDIAEKYGLKEKKGALVLNVDGPAKDAGLKPGDLIIEYDGKVVSDNAHLSKMVAASKPNDKVKIKAIREGKEKEFTVKLAERTSEVVSKMRGDESTPSEDSEEWMGMSVQELTDALAQRLGYEGQEGVLITDVDPSGPAAQVDNPPARGDLIQEIEGMPIKNMSDYREALGKIKDENRVMVRLRRASTGNSWYVVLKKE